ncbi:cytochrome c-type biogenesis protein CcmF [Lacibacter cauensis]|uniref:Cytochrome c-type biogenesis protein CcmF n=1 Tax=Lacibacter cauensis TaxID=510947 RepID=A0A562SVK0_9BACT|nr:cytochrome c biogenesis protein CcsA [Lacibacter cauensis]TWI85329.1 cytochrome c-type biogenesis protein CcmF [Lacibacter cauensis]
MPYTGEQLLPGQIGTFLSIVSFVASLLATVAYFKATQSQLPSQQQSWKRIARGAFLAEIIAVIGIFVTLYFIISNHRFEYKYAWQHSNYQLPMQYILSCFWEGQEGSFLLWSFWHCILGGIIILREKKWEAPVMVTISFMQFALATMVIGIYFFDFKIGSNPFVLMRDQGMLSPEQFPIGFDSQGHLRSDYLSFIRDGNGLNPLLQNYWMVIHPPVLFLGFASTIVPFAFAIAGLWKKDFGGWVLPARPWAIFSAGILGLGIMMGAAWAYESLTFGGYWAWDPVENASLVPWLIAICGIHTLIAYKHTGHSLRATFLFFILQHLLIIYSTFLTRSGILGDTSVHAFTDLGMNAQLLTFLLIFVVPSFVLLGMRYKQIPTVAKEEVISAREFWLFVGSLLFFISALFIIGKTSLPVVNKIFGTKYAPAEDIEYSYNKVLILFSFVIAILTAISQYLKYKQTAGAAFIKSIWLPTLIALVASLSISIWGDINYNKYGVGYLAAIHLSIFASVYAVVANAFYIFTGIKGKMIKAGASIAHVGFGLTLLGILISASKKEVLSWNTSGIMVNFGEQSQENPAENLTLVKGVATDMGKYMVTYQGDSTHPSDPKQYFKIHFKYKNKDEGFTLYPDAFVNFKGNEGIMANPDSKHYLHKDVFTYITSLPNKEKNRDTSSFKDHKLQPGDTVFYSQGFMVLDKVGRNITRKNIPYEATDSVFAASLTIYAKDSSKYTAEPMLILRGNNIMPVADTVISQSLILAFKGADADGINLGVKESNSVLEYVTLKAYQFPAINVLWLGILVMTFGFLLASWNHIQKNRKAELKKV